MSDLNALISQTEQKYGLPAGILAATAQVESHGDPGAVSPQGAQGVMQLLPSTAKSLGADPFNVPQAVDAAGRLWSQNLKATGGDIDKAAMMYHGGTDQRNWGPRTHAYPAKLAAALGPQAASQPAPQQSGDPIEAALSGGQPSAPQTSAPAQGGADPIEAALQGGAQSPTPDFSDANLQMKRMYEKNAKTADIVAFGQQHGLTPNAAQIEQARKQGFGTVNFALPDPNAQPQQPQTNQALGFAEGLMKPIDNAATWLKHGADKLGVGGAIDSLGSSLGLPSLQQANANQQSYFKAQEAQGQTPGEWGKLAGNVAATIPLAAITKNPWAAGALTGAISTDDPNNLQQTAVDAGLGAVGGKVVHAGVSALSGAIEPQVSKAVQALHDLGVQMTPGQIMGGALRRIEDAATSIPLVGDLVKNAQRRSVLSLNNSVINNRVLAPIKQALPDGMSGREAVDYADKAVSDAYQGILPKLTVKADEPFIQNVGQILKTADELPPDRAAQVQRIVTNSLGDRFNRPGYDMSGNTFKEADAKLGQLARDYNSSPDPEQRKMGGIFRDVQGELRGILQRQNPEQAEELGNINGAFANLVRVEGAAGSAGAKGGVFTPAQLASAVKRYDSSSRDKAYATGKALLQDVSDPANEVLPQTLPDSGTPFRTVGAYLLGGGLAHVSPWAAPAMAPIGLYTKAGQKAFQGAALAPRGPGAKALANALTKLKTPLAIAGGAASAEAANGR